MTNYIYTILIISHLITMQTNKINILDNDRNNWLVVNDNVMGGVSESNIRFSENNTLIFQGRVSIENNGGFASFRYNTKNLKVNKDQKIKMVVIGDSKEYQIRIKPSQNIRYTYSKTFKTTNSKQIIEIPLNEFTAQYRGYKLNMENFVRIVMEKQEGTTKLDESIFPTTEIYESAQGATVIEIPLEREGERFGGDSTS